MKIRWQSSLPLALVALGVASSVRSDPFPANHFAARLRGFNETPAVSTMAMGTFEATISDDESTITFRFRYSGLSADPTAAHIHLGQPNVAGGVIAFLCGGGSKPACPTAPADITGTIVADDVIGPTGQGIAAGALADVIRAIRSGFVYANIHNSKFPSGEMRGQLRPSFAH